LPAFRPVKWRMAEERAGNAAALAAVNTSLVRGTRTIPAATLRKYPLALLEAMSSIHACWKVHA
jgi:hypothetical protein